MKINTLIYLTGIYSLVTLGVISIYIIVGYLSVNHINGKNYKKFRKPIDFLNYATIFLNIVVFFASLFYDAFVQKIGVCLSVPSVGIVQIIIAYIIIYVCYYQRFGVEF